MREVEHKITMKHYGFLDWYCYHYKNYILFRVGVTILSSLIGILLGIVLSMLLLS